MENKPLTKVCRDCGRELPISSFYKNGTSYRPECKECKNKAEAERRRNNIEKYKKLSKEKYWANRDKELSHMKAYRESLKKNNYLKFFIQNKKKLVIRAGIDWDLDEEYLKSLFTGVCPVFNCQIHLGGAKDEYKAELDRLVPSLGYVKGNVRWISRRANRIKSDASIEEIKAILKYMENNIEQ